MCISLPIDLKYGIIGQNMGNSVENNHFEELLITPYKDESLLSWILRQSEKFQVKPKDFIKSEQRYWRSKKGIEFYPKNYSKITDWLMIIDFLPQNFQFYSILRKRGLLNGGRNLQLSLSDWINPENQNHNYKAFLCNTFDFNVRYCPKCWKKKGNRYLKKIWRHNLLIICPEHGIPLIHECPMCDHKLVPELAEFTTKQYVNCQKCSLDLLNYKYKTNEIIQSVQKNVIMKFLLNDQLPVSKSMINNNIYGLPLSKEVILFAKMMVEKVGYRGFYGYENAKAIIQSLAKEQQQVPSAARNRIGRLINYHIRLKRWIVFGINKWDDFLVQLFGCTSEQPKFYRGLNGLDRAIEMIKSHKRILQRIPKSSDKNMRPIHRSILRGEWRNENIFNWSDILRMTFF
ncbi:MAG: TniQ family protein [Candidatus Hodarchaeota archaeon]